MEKLTELLGFEGRYLVYPLAALVIAGIFKLVIHRYLHKWSQRTESPVDDLVVAYVDRTILPLMLLAILYWVSIWVPLPEAAAGYGRKSLVVLAVFVVTLFTAKLASSILEVFQGRQENLRRFLQPLRMLSNVLFLLISIALALRILNINLTNEAMRLVRIVGIIVGALVLLRIIKLAVLHMEQLVEDKDTTSLSEAEKRAKTLGKIINSAGIVLVSGIAIMMTLSEFGINIAPIITGAGIAGLAVGFGAQNLVRDIISGFFLIFEDQIRIGDSVRINGAAGTVEAIRLRTTILRDLEGVVHIFPNGEIKQVANMTKEFSYYVINVGVAYKESVDEVMEVLEKTGAELAQDPAFSSLILAPLEILGVDDFTDSQVKIKIRIKTVPQQQWAVGRELRRRIKNTFDSKGIEIPFPHVSVYFGEASKPFDLAVRSAPQDAGDET
jgi:moderate conductance mechanosensitive channel